jgi:hypothetical protein
MDAESRRIWKRLHLQPPDLRRISLRGKSLLHGHRLTPTCLQSGFRTAAVREKQCGGKPLSDSGATSVDHDLAPEILGFAQGYRWPHEAFAEVQPFVTLEFVRRLDGWAIGIRRSSRELNGLTFYRGSQWISLNRRAALATLNVERQLREWFTRSWIPDETYIHTVLRAAGLRVRNAPTTFVLEEPAKPTAGWMQLKLQDLPAVWESHTPFARKVDISSRPEVAAASDEVVDAHRLSNAPDRSGEAHQDPSRP